MQIPFFNKIAQGENILIAGAGGGFDVVSGIPLYIYLRNLGKNVTLANLSFTHLNFTDSVEFCPGTYQVTLDSTDVPYFPEKYILEWLSRELGESPSFYGFSNSLGVLPLKHAYERIAEKHAIDTVVLVDGGTDSLMFGDEVKVGTIVEDACSIVAASQLNVANKYLASIGFGVEHEFNHHACLENIATLVKGDAYLGAVSLTRDMVEAKTYLKVVQYLNEKMGLHRSIVTNSIASALAGEFGDVHHTARTKESVQFVNPLMSIFWFFELTGLSSRIHFSEGILGTQTMDEVAKAFQYYRLMNKRRLHQEIPLK